jgi:hypothetical protein
MKVKEFKSVLEENLSREVRFEYSAGKFAEASYHLTEVKNVLFDTTDCGGKTNQWKETHLQLWESPAEAGKRNYMAAGKLLAILNRVNGIKALWTETEIKVEYGNPMFPTGVMPVSEARVSGKYLDVILFEEKALCKGIIQEKQETSETACCQEELNCC